MDVDRAARPRSVIDNASDFGDCGFESHRGRDFEVGHVNGTRLTELD